MAEAQSLGAKSSGKNNYNRSPSKRPPRTPPIPVSLPRRSTFASNPNHTPHIHGTTSHIRGSPILYKILAVVTLGALYYYFFFFYNDTACQRWYEPVSGSDSDRRTTILTTHHCSNGAYVSRACSRAACSFDSRSNRDTHGSRRTNNRETRVTARPRYHRL